MPIRFKNIPVVASSDLFQKHLNTILSPLEEKKEKMEYATKKLKAACVATELIKKNIIALGKVSSDSDPFKTAEAKNLTVLSAIIDKTAQNPENQQTIKDYLSDLSNLRKENQLVYGKRSKEAHLSLGLGLVDYESRVPLYKKKITSTAFYNGQNLLGAAQFMVTADNEIVIPPKFETGVNSPLSMMQGTFIKGAGSIQIGNVEIKEKVDGVAYPEILEGEIKYISSYHVYFDVPEECIAFTLFLLRDKLGVNLSKTKVVIPNDKAPLIDSISDCNMSIHGEIKNASYYLDENHFPGAKVLAEKKLTFLDKLDEIFCYIDDQILVKRNKRFIEETYGEKELLKLNLIKLFICTKEYINKTEKKDKKIKAITKTIDFINRPTTSFHPVIDPSVEIKNHSEETGLSFNDYWPAIKSSIKFFKEKNIDLSFLFYEINMLLAYILKNSLTTSEKNQLQEWSTSESKILGRELDIENIPDYIKFYDRDPIKTCIALLKDYSKGVGWQGAICRFFLGAWNRHYKDPVNKFLSIYNKNELPNNLTICDIYIKLKESGLMFNFDAEGKSSLRKILLFCAQLNREEKNLLDLIINYSFTSFPPLDQDKEVDCCFGT